MEAAMKRPPVLNEASMAVHVGQEDGGKISVKFGNGAQSCDGESSKSSSHGLKGSGLKRQASMDIASKLRPVAMDISSAAPPTSTDTVNKLESTKAELGEVREENERLNMVLARIVRDYQALQMHYFDVMRRDQQQKTSDTGAETSCAAANGDCTEEQELVSLSLGTMSSSSKKEEKTKAGKGKEGSLEGGLTLGLVPKLEGSSNDNSGEPVPRSSNPEDSLGEPKEEEASGDQPWQTSKMPRNTSEEEEQASLQQAQVKKARVSVRARCDAPTMNDGCQWRKYGQKIAKGNPCPRAYYRCTVAPACPVRKQVQRCADDMSILITTYEGSHNHPLPYSATAIASTTSAAASMLTSGSSISGRPIIKSPPPPYSAAAAAATTTLEGLNFSISEENSRSRQLYLPNTSMASNPSFPTITLDLTAPRTSASQAPHLNRMIPPSFVSEPRLSSTSFSFSSSESTSMSSTWSNCYQQYGALPFNKSLPSSFENRQQETFYQSYLNKASGQGLVPPAQNPLTESIAKAITSDPSFRSALTAVISSYVGAGGRSSVQGGAGEGMSSGIRWEEQLNTAVPAYGAAHAKASSNGSGAMFLQPQLDSTKSALATPADDRENIN